MFLPVWQILFPVFASRFLATSTRTACLPHQHQLGNERWVRPGRIDKILTGKDWEDFIGIGCGTSKDVLKGWMVPDNEAL